MLNKEDTGLIVVDIQGKLATLVDDSETIIENCGKLIQGAKALGLPIIWLEQNPEKLGPTVDSISELMADQTPIPKFTFDGCNEVAFKHALNEAQKHSWIVCGIEAHICVYQTATHLANLHFDVHVVSDCTSSRDSRNKELALSKFASRNVKITGLEMCLYELVKDCRAPEFKQILNLIK
ncbi:isochorismatase family protein [Vibrio panuliri]|uniref:Hydrolase n=1 Tax=Vibrio panuliri TaxID=1381081 RepID=A0A1Q9HJ09_9VIBR|nr:isochorismatase family protein [Vibrio panuliri]KAB1454164.1 isochorismatase family protein [Vibrio panuliri]OLQ86465.1 hydrolase [Vibrio panuliri]OLQ90301.1 hydrolase [Vibrio panuliri]